MKKGKWRRAAGVALMMGGNVEDIDFGVQSTLGSLSGDHLRHDSFVNNSDIAVSARGHPL